jgi:hypothetical protein
VAEKEEVFIFRTDESGGGPRNTRARFTRAARKPLSAVSMEATGSAEDKVQPPPMATGRQQHTRVLLPPLRTGMDQRPWRSRGFRGARAGPPMPRPRSNREVVDDPARFGPTGRRGGHRAREGLSQWPAGPTCKRDSARWKGVLGRACAGKWMGRIGDWAQRPFQIPIFFSFFIFCSFSFQFYFQIKFQFHFKLKMCSQFIFALNVQFEHSM